MSIRFLSAVSLILALISSSSIQLAADEPVKVGVIGLDNYQSAVFTAFPNFSLPERVIRS